MQSGGPPITAVSSVPGSANSVSSAANTSPKPAGNSAVTRNSQHPSYHVPRGAAAVANIAMPRSASLATPIVRSGPGAPGSLVTIRGSNRAPSPAPQQPRVRPAAASAHVGSRQLTPQRADTPRPTLMPSSEKPVVKSAVSLSQVSGQTAPFISTTAARVATAPSTPSIQPLQAVSQPTMQVITQTAQVTGMPLSSQTTGNIQSSTSTITSVAGGRPRPVSQATQAGSASVVAPAVVLTTPSRLTSPGLLGVPAGQARLTVATAVPAAGARIVGPTSRLPQGRAVAYTGSHQVLQTTRLPPAPSVRLGPPSRGVLSLHPVPVLGVAPLKSVPAPVTTTASPALSVSQASLSVSQTSIQPGTQTAVLSTPQISAPPAPLPSPAPLRTLPVQAVQAAQPKVMSSAVVTVAAVSGGSIRSVVAAVPPPSAGPAIAPALAISPSPTPTAASASKTASAYVQTSTTVAARPVAVATQPPRPGQAQPIYIQTHRSSPGPTTERGGTFPIPPTYYYEPSPGPGAYQVASVGGRPYTAGSPYIVQAAAGTRPVASSGIVASSTVPGTAVTSTAAAVASSVMSSVPSGQSPRFNSIMVVDPSRPTLPMHAAYVPAEGGAAGTTFIATEGGSLVPVQALPVPTAAVHTTTAVVPHPGPTLGSQAPAQAVPQAAIVSAGQAQAQAHLPMQIQMVSTPVHIQMHTQTQGQPTQGHQPSGQPHLSVHVATHPPSHLTSLPGHLPPQTSLSISHAPTVTMSTSSHLPSNPQSHAPLLSSGIQSSPQSHVTVRTPILPATQAQTQPQTTVSSSKLNASPRPSILRKRDNDGSPLKAQKNLTPLLQSMGASNIVANPAVSTPASPPSPPKRPDSGGPQSSGSTTISATSSPGQESPPPGTQPPPSAASITAGLHAAGLHSNEMSPRKKPRKQQLTGNELQEHKANEDDMEFLTEVKEDDFHRRQPEQHLQAPSSVPSHQQQLAMQEEQLAMQLPQPGPPQPAPPAAPREYALKRPNVSLLSTYRYSWKSRHNHFLRHSDVKPKDERRPTVGELAAQRHIFQRLNGWKVHHLTTQMEDLAEVESQVFQQLEAMLGVMERKAEQDVDKDVNRVNELIKGNMQRSRVIADQLVEAKTTVMKIFDHKSHVAEIINRSSGKRTFKKRDKS